MGNSPGDQPVLRRSLRILAQQTKLIPNPSPPQSGSQVEGILSAQEIKEGSRDNKGSTSRKRKRLSSPCPPLPEKESKKSPVHKAKRRKSDTSVAKEGVVKEGVKSSRGESSPAKRSPRKKKEHTTKGNSSNQERETVIVDASKPARKSGRKSAQTTSDSTDSADHTPSELPVAGKKARAKNRSNSKRGERTSSSKGKGRSGWNTASCYSLPSLADFARLNMASPG